MSANISLISGFKSSVVENSMSQQLIVLASGMGKRVVTFIKSRPGFAVIGFACGYGAIYMIDTLKERYLQKKPSQPPSLHLLSERTQFLAKTSKTIWGATGLVMIAEILRVGRLNTSPNVRLFLLGIGVNIGQYVRYRQIRKTSDSVVNITANPPRSLVDIRVDITANPPHLGHMAMIAIAIEQLVQKGYLIGQVKVELAPEDYTQTKVERENGLIQNTPDNKKPLKVALPLVTRIKFLEAVIQEAKGENLFSNDLRISYSDRDRRQETNTTFFVCGQDYADHYATHDFFIKKKYVVVVTRNGKTPATFKATETRMIVDNPNSTNTYSSSNIQNGNYKLLPESIRKEFEQLHQAAQLNPRKTESSC